MIFASFHQKKESRTLHNKNIEHNADFEQILLWACRFVMKKIHKVLKAVLSIVTNLSDDDKTAFFHL